MEEFAVTAVYFEFYGCKKITPKLRKAVEKVFNDEIVDKLFKLGVRRITIANQKYEFNSGKKPTPKLRKAVDKVFTCKLIDKLVKLGLIRITMGKRFYKKNER